jgi:hypothetical protein
VTQGRVAAISDGSSQITFLVLDMPYSTIEQDHEDLMKNILRRLPIRQDHQGIAVERCAERIVEAGSLMSFRRHLLDYRRGRSRVLSREAQS